MGIVGFFFMWRVARSVTSGVRVRTGCRRNPDRDSQSGQINQVIRAVAQIRRAAGIDRLRLGLPDEFDGLLLMDLLPALWQMDDR